MEPDEARRVLGVSADASAKQIRSARRRLAKQLHPDVAGASAREGAAAGERMRAVNEAYATLMRAPAKPQGASETMPCWRCGAERPAAGGFCPACDAFSPPAHAAWQMPGQFAGRGTILVAAAALAPLLSWVAISSGAWFLAPVIIFAIVGGGLALASRQP